MRRGSEPREVSLLDSLQLLICLLPPLTVPSMRQDGISCGPRIHLDELSRLRIEETHATIEGSNWQASRIDISFMNGPK